MNRYGKWNWSAEQILTTAFFLVVGVIVEAYGFFNDLPVLEEPGAVLLGMGFFSLALKWQTQ